MRIPNDRKLAEQVPEIDLVLGGHDHQSISEMSENSGICIVKSGTDFEEFSDLTLYLGVSKQESEELIKEHQTAGDYDEREYHYSEKK